MVNMTIAVHFVRENFLLSINAEKTAVVKIFN